MAQTGTGEKKKKPKLILKIFKHSARTSKKTQLLTITKIN
jgi:hypothetical protein